MYWKYKLERDYVWAPAERGSPQTSGFAADASAESEASRRTSHDEVD